MNLKAMIEKRTALIAELDELCKKASAETRAFTADEKKAYDEKKQEADALTDTIRSMQEQEQRSLEQSKSEPAATKAEEAELRAFEDYLRSGVLVENRATNMTKSDNGAVIPATIADKIIRKVIDICPIYQMATRYTLAGTLSIPYYDESSQSISMAYATEFTDLESSSGKFLSIELKGYLAGALSLVSRSLINNSKFDIVSYVINEVSIAAAKWIENQLINGTTSKIDGLAAGVTQTVTTASATAITADELIDLQEAIPDVYQDNACWIMNKSTRTAIRKLKDSEGRYILNPDATAKWGYTLFGKPVYTTDSVSAIASEKATIYYGDMSGLAVKTSEDVSIQILNEKYATQHAVGVIAWVELDAKVENAQKIAVLKMKKAG